MLYYAYEFQRQLAQPVRLWANAVEQASSSPYNPLADTWFGKSMAAGAEIVARLTRDYGKPAFGLATTEVDGATVAVNEEILLRKPFCQLLRFRRDTAQALAQGAAGGADERPLRDPAARHGRGAAARPRRPHHRLDRCPRGAAGAGQFRSRRLHRLHHRILPLPRPRRACDRRLPAVGAGDGRRLADGAGQGSAPAALAHPDGRPDRHAPEPDRPQRPGDAQLDDVVPPERDLDGAVQLSGRAAAGLSGLPAAHQLHLHESRPARQRPHAAVRAPGQRRRRQRRRPSPFLRRVSGGDGSHRRVSISRPSRSSSRSTCCRAAPG